MAEESSSEKTVQDEDAEFTTMAYAADERTKDGFVRVIVGVRGLKTSSQVILKGFRVPKVVKEADNAKVDVEIEDRSFCLTVIGSKGDLKGKKMRLRIKKLPAIIKNESSYVEIEKDRILMFLKKSENKSWYPAIEEGLDMDED